MSRKSKYLLSLSVVLIVAIALFFTTDKNTQKDSSSAAAVGTTTSTVSPAKGEDKILAAFLDVGQADCALFTLPDGKILLIDAGDRGDGDQLVDYLKKRGIIKIDYLLATHPHSDHIGGMSDVIDSFEIGKIFAPKVASNDLPTSKTYESFLTSDG
mgnify:FL=1